MGKVVRTGIYGSVVGWVVEDYVIDCPFLTRYIGCKNGFCFMHGIHNLLNIFLNLKDIQEEVIMNKYHKYIRNEIAYFRTVVRNMNIKEYNQNEIWEEYEPFIEEIYFDKQTSIEFSDNLISQKDLLGWIDLLENQDLYIAVKSLSIEDQIFLSQFIIKDKTQQDVAKIYKKVSQQ